MADAMTIARPYANALFAQASEHQQLTQWSSVLNHLALLVKDSQMKTLIDNPAWTQEKLLALFEELIQATDKKDSEKLGVTLKNFLRLVILEGRLVNMPEIAHLYHELLIKQEGLIEAHVTSAFALSEDHRQQIQEKLTKRFNKKVEMVISKDESLIGGAIVRVGDWVMDGSVKGKLARLAENL